MLHSRLEIFSIETIWYQKEKWPSFSNGFWNNRVAMLFNKRLWSVPCPTVQASFKFLIQACTWWRMIFFHSTEINIAQSILLYITRNGQLIFVNDIKQELLSSCLQEYHSIAAQFYFHATWSQRLETFWRLYFVHFTLFYFHSSRAHSFKIINN